MIMSGRLNYDSPDYASLFKQTTMSRRHRYLKSQSRVYVANIIHLIMNQRSDIVEGSAEILCIFLPPQVSFTCDARDRIAF